VAEDSGANVHGSITFRAFHIRSATGYGCVLDWELTVALMGDAEHHRPDHRRNTLTPSLFTAGLLPLRPTAASQFLARERQHLRRYQFNCRQARDADKKPKRLSEIRPL
jgi:hypothetical protein